MDEPQTELRLAFSSPKCLQELVAPSYYFDFHVNSKKIPFSICETPNTCVSIVNTTDIGLVPAAQATRWVLDGGYVCAEHDQNTCIGARGESRVGVVARGNASTLVLEEDVNGFSSSVCMDHGDYCLDGEMQITERSSECKDLDERCVHCPTAGVFPIACMPLGAAVLPHCPWHACPPIHS